MAATTASAMTPTGSETKNTQRQSAWSEIQPPVVGPITDAKPKTAPVRPCQRPRSDGGMRSPIVATASGISAPAPRPWTARPVDELGHRAGEAADHGAAMKMRMPATKKRRRP